MNTDKDIFIMSLTMELAQYIGGLDVKELKSKIEESAKDYAINKAVVGLPVTTDGSTTKTLLQEFIQVKRAGGRFSKNTEKLYIHVIKQFVNYTKKEILLANHRDIIEFLNYYRDEKGCTNTTIKNKRNILSSFFSYLKDYNYIADNPIVKTPPIKSDTIKRKPLTKLDMELLRTACEHDNTEKGKRNYAMLNFLYESGCRISEALSIKIRDVDFTNCSVTVRGKGGKYRTVIFGAGTLIRLQDYFEKRSDIINDAVMGLQYPVDAPLFSSVDKTHHALHTRTAEKQLKQYCEKLGMRNVHPHLLRHTCATNLLKSGFTLSEISDYLGHADISTTQRYLHITQDEFANKYKTLID